VSNSPLPELFDPDLMSGTFRDVFLSQVGSLASAPLNKMRALFGSLAAAGQSALEGPGQPNYVDRVLESGGSAVFLDEIAQRLAEVDLSACYADPVTPEAVLRRTSALTCAGCHAPQQILGPERAIGCGLAWPDSLGQPHIDEYGALSEALTDVL